VRSLFKVKDYFATEDGEGGEYSVVYEERSRAAFKELYRKVQPMGYTPRLFGTRDDASLTVFKTAPEPSPAPRASFFLAMLTIVAILGAGVAVGLLYAQDFGGSDILYGASFVLGIAVILLARDLVQRYFARRAGSPATLHYYLPNIPVFLALPILYFMPTFGSVTFVRSPAYDRDALFDFYFWGAIAAVGVTMAVALAGVPSTIVLTQAQYAASGVVALSHAPSTLQNLAGSIMSALNLSPSVPAGGYAISSPLSAAAWVGFLLSLVTLMPAALFDGGRMATLVLGTRGSRITTLFTAFALVAIDPPNYWVIFLVIFLLAAVQPSNDTLDSLSGISLSRKGLFVIAMLIVLLCIPVPQTFFTFSV